MLELPALRRELSLKMELPVFVTGFLFLTLVGYANLAVGVALQWTSSCRKTWLPEFCTYWEVLLAPVVCVWSCYACDGGASLWFWCLFFYRDLGSDLIEMLLAEFFGLCFRLRL